MRPEPWQRCPRRRRQQRRRPPAAAEAAAPEAGTPATPAAPFTDPGERIRASTPTPDTLILDTAIAVLSDNGKAKKRKGRKDGKPKALSAKGEAQARAGVKVTDAEPKAKKAKRWRDAA